MQHEQCKTMQDRGAHDDHTTNSMRPPDPTPSSTTYPHLRIHGTCTMSLFFRFRTHTVRRKCSRATQAKQCSRRLAATPPAPGRPCARGVALKAKAFEFVCMCCVNHLALLSKAVSAFRATHPRLQQTKTHSTRCHSWDKSSLSRKDKSPTKCQTPQSTSPLNVCFDKREEKYASALHVSVT